MSTQEPVLGYAFWTSPDGSRKIIYSLAVFQEIDNSVNDGYRRIPHGGVETGGLLFGIREGPNLRIEAYRPLECQHAFGPSFLLSDLDLEAAREQLTSFQSDPELASFEPLGWFIGHTRSALQMTDREIAWFHSLFPAPDALTVLIKPERFQPTHFAFVIRNSAGEVRRDDSSAPVILPLSSAGAVGRPPAPSIAAPIREAGEPPAAPPKAARRDRLDNPDFTPSRQQDAHPEPSDFRPPASRAEQTSPPEPSSDLPPRPPAHEPTRVRRQAAFPDQVAPAVPYELPPLPDRVAAHRQRSGSGFGLQSIAILVLAAVLGCLAGYWAYLQLPSPVIPVSIREQAGQLVVEWPSSLTKNVDYAALQINDGQWIPLTAEQKNAGHSTIPAPSGNVKIDLIAKHWLRDSRGIVRYVRR